MDWLAWQQNLHLQQQQQQQAIQQLLHFQQQQQQQQLLNRVGKQQLLQQRDQQTLGVLQPFLPVVAPTPSNTPTPPPVGAATAHPTSSSSSSASAAVPLPPAAAVEVECRGNAVALDNSVSTDTVVMDTARTQLPMDTVRSAVSGDSVPVDFVQQLENIAELCDVDLVQETAAESTYGRSGGSHVRRARVLLPPADGIEEDFAEISKKVASSKERFPRPSGTSRLYDVGECPWPAKAPHLNTSFKAYNILPTTAEPPVTVPQQVLTDVETAALGSTSVASFMDWAGSAVQELLRRMAEIVSQSPPAEDAELLSQMLTDAISMSESQGKALYEVRRNAVLTAGTCRLLRRQAVLDRMVGVPEQLKLKLRAGSLGSPELFEEGVLTWDSLRDHETHQVHQVLLKEKTHVTVRQPFRDNNNRSSNNSSNNSNNTAKKRVPYKGKRQQQSKTDNSGPRKAAGKRGASGGTGGTGSFSSSSSKYRKS